MQPAHKAYSQNSWSACRKVAGLWSSRKSRSASICSSSRIRCALFPCLASWTEFDLTAKDVFEQIERLRARVHERVGWPAFDFLLEAVDALPHKFLIVEHHARKAGGRHEWIFAVDKAAGRRVV